MEYRIAKRVGELKLDSRRKLCGIRWIGARLRSHAGMSWKEERVERIVLVTEGFPPGMLVVRRTLGGFRSGTTTSREGVLRTSGSRW